MGLLYKSHLSGAGNVGKNGSGKAPRILNGNAGKEIDAYVARHPKLWGFIFDDGGGVAETEAEILAGLVKGAVSTIGIGARLRPGKMLVLVPASLDRELVAHRIRVNYRMTDSYAFSMTGGDDINAMIKNYW
jgi:hypothetical protein